MATKILMVCLGNICRSPLAEGILRSKLPSTLFEVDSCGTGNWHIGNPPDARSIAVAKKNGLDIANLKGRQFSKSDFQNFDYIYAMDNQNYKEIMSLATTESEKIKVKLILEAIFPNENVDVPDPYFGLQDGFESVYTMLDDACNEIENKLI